MMISNCHPGLATWFAIVLLSAGCGVGATPSVYGASPASAPTQQPNNSPATAAPTADENTNGMNGNNTTVGDGNLIIGPTYTVAPEFKVQVNVPHGMVQSFTVPSAGSKFYDVTPSFQRTVWVYIPKQYVPQTEAPVMVVQDGGVYETSWPTVLDNLIATKELPVMVAVFINPGPTLSQRSIEYDTVSGKYADFVETEILPAVATRYNVRFTQDPWGRATLGGSSGGSAAFSMAWFRPDLYRRVGTYSGSYTALRPDATYPQGAWDYHTFVIADAPNRFLRVALEVGEHDHVFPVPYRNTIVANQQMAQMLSDRDYHERFTYALDANHVDPRVWHQNLPDTLRWLWRGYPIL